LSELEKFLRRVPNFYESGHVEKISLFGWYLHAVEMNTRFSGSEILRCYDDSHIKRPSNINQQLADLLRKNPPDLLRDSKGYYLERRKRSALDAVYLENESKVQTSQLIEDLPSLIANLNEKNFLTESLVCYRNGAFRAAIVMTWNLVYSHFCEWLLRHHLAKFNTQWPIRYPDHHKKSKIKTVQQYDHFSELKESEVIEISRSAGLIDQAMHKSLIEKLGKRNTAAHPSTQTITQIQADEVIHDLVANVLLKLS